MFRLVWALMATACAGLTAYLAFQEPERFAAIVDLAATVISILMSVSLALMAFLSSPFSVSEDFSKDSGERKRINSVIQRDDGDFFDGQLMLFAVYFISLGALLMLKWHIVLPNGDEVSRYVRTLSAIAAFASVISFFWSARLPSMLRNLAKQRRDFG